MQADKYGTGVGSVHRAEAPTRGRQSARLVKGPTIPTATKSSWQQRAEQSNKTLLRTCCASSRLGQHRTVLFVGCSQLENLFDHLCVSGPASVGLGRGKQKHRACMERSTLLAMVVAAGKWARAFPSFHRAGVALEAVRSAGLPAPSAGVSNFASTHLLHVHPVRPFFDALGVESRAVVRCYPQSTCADFRGLVGFDAQVANDVSVVRRSLPSAALVLMTPNWICDAKLYAQYRKQLAAPEPARWSKCIAWVEARSRSHSGEAAREICARDTFSAAGSERMAERVRAAARAAGSSQSLPPVRLLDALAITRDGGGCNATEDARHFPSLVPTQERELRAVLNG